MAIVTRYFSTAGAGAADGTTWADRAQLINAGTWSSVITAFDFSGSDSLMCFVGPGTSTVTTTFAVGLFANPPTIANPILFHGCDGNGDALSPPNPDWTSDTPAFDDSTLPVFATTSDATTLTVPASFWRLIKFTASARNGAMVGGTSLIFDWCVFINSHSGTSAAICSSGTGFTNCVFSMTGDSYLAAINQVGALFTNCKILGVTGSSGNRRGVDAASGTRLVRCCISGFGGIGWNAASTSTGQTYALSQCVIANNGQGLLFASTAAQTLAQFVDRCMITGNGAPGIDGRTNSRIIATQNRLRDNVTANIQNLGNFSTTWGTYTTDSDDSLEYVDASSNNFQIKNTATIWGMGFGVSEEAPSAVVSGSSYRPTQRNLPDIKV
jgi:hypothetical protein